VLEGQSRADVLGRIQASVLEPGTIALLREVGFDARMDPQGHTHDGTGTVWEGQPLLLIATKKFTGMAVTSYGQTAITEDPLATRGTVGGQIIDEAGNIGLHDPTADRPYMTYEKEGSSRRIDCNYVAGCDRFHGSVGYRRPTRRATP
jgi:p-hydroxybenzoate 3-monooxygenase